MDCIVIDVNYVDPLTSFTFWIFEENGVVLQRSVATLSKNKKRTVVSSVTALTLNETIGDAVFQFTPPPGAKLVPSAPSVVAVAQ
jgi:outer membrane lipoprotein-sorting protein